MTKKVIFVVAASILLIAALWFANEVIKVKKTAYLTQDECRKEYTLEW